MSQFEISCAQKLNVLAYFGMDSKQKTENLTFLAQKLQNTNMHDWQTLLPLLIPLISAKRLLNWEKIQIISLFPVKIIGQINYL